MSYIIVKREFNSRGQVIREKRLGEAVHKDQATHLARSMNNDRSPSARRALDYIVSEARTGRLPSFKKSLN